MNHASQKEWEETWKHFQEVVGFIYDNKGVIQNLEKQKLSASSNETNTTLDEQIEEIHILLQNHQEDLLETLGKARQLSPKKVEPYLSKIQRSIEKLDTKSLTEIVSQITK